LTGECLEGTALFLAGRGWVEIGSRYDTISEAETLDGYLKGCIERATAGWVAAVLEKRRVSPRSIGRVRQECIAPATYPSVVGSPDP
jgi:hypothetical protein